MDTKAHNRREFLKRFSAVSAVGIGASTVLAACGGESASDAPAAAAGCMDTSGLTEQEISMRNTLAYVDETADPAKNCLNCSLYLPAAAGAACGGCNLLKGPIAPNGYCISWAPAQT